jgi:photosystem II stability/assembly factor-like uncharacterized protein
MKKINVIARVGLFALILSLGTFSALIVGETKGLALADLSGMPMRAMAAATHGDVMYAALSGGQRVAGIYRSEDNGGTWQRVGSGPNAEINTLAVHPNQQTILYAGTAGGPAATTDSLWRSYDGGQTWHKSMLGLPASPEGMLPAVTALVVDPRQPGVLYVGTDGHGVYRFDADLNRYGYELMGGISLYRAHVNGLVVGPDGRVYALTNEGLFVTAGEGVWQELPTPEMMTSLAVASDDPERLYAGGVSIGLFRSTDGGQTWEQASRGIEMVSGTALRVTALTIDDEKPRHIVASTAYGLGSRLAPDAIYESTDGGYSWTRRADTSEIVKQLTLNQSGIFVATESGITYHLEPGAPSSAAASSSQQYGALTSLFQKQEPFQRLLSKPNGLQVLILALTVVSAGLALVGRVEWVLNRKAQTAQS